MFKGFGLSYPEYEVLTPQTHQSYKLRSLNVQEEERLKGSFVTPIKITEHLNKCIFDSMTMKPEHVVDFTSFLKNTTLKDRDSLLYGLYHVSYEEIRNYDIKCASCRKDYTVTVSASSTFNFNSYPEEDILTKRLKIDLPVSKGVRAVIKQPTLFDEIEVLKNHGGAPGKSIELLTETLILDRFEQDMETSTEPKVYSDKDDVIDAYLTLPARDKRFIHESYREAFGQFGISLKMKTYCTHCSNESIVDIDMVEAFFRMVYTA